MTAPAGQRPVVVRVTGVQVVALWLLGLLLVAAFVAAFARADPDRYPTPPTTTVTFTTGPRMQP